MSGPGTELGKLLPKWLTKQGNGCGCRDRAKQYDKWGVDGCRERRERIVNDLLAQTHYLPLVLRQMPESIRRMTAKLLIDQAISAAEQKDR